MRETTLLRRIFNILVIFALTILFFTCSDGLKNQEQQDKAEVSFSVTDNSARTVLPQVSISDVDHYELLGELNDEAETVLVESFTGMGTTVTLDIGTWNFTLNAYNSSGKHILQGKVQNKQINLTGTNQVSFSLSAVRSGKGSIQITLNFPETAGITNISTNISSHNYDGNEDFPSITDNTFVYAKNDIEAGDYFINFELYNGELLKAVVSELVLVRNNLTSSKTITLVGENLKPLPTFEIVVNPLIIGIDEWELTTQSTQAVPNENTLLTVNGTYAAYQWYLDGEPAANSSEYIFCKPFGVYELVVVVTNSNGESRSGRCRITVSVSAPTVYTVTYNINGGSGTLPPAQAVKAGSSITILGGSGLTRSGYVFGGWNTAAAGNGTNYSVGSSYKPMANITLYAKWNTTYTVTFAANSGTGTAPLTRTVNAGTKITLPDRNNLTRTNYAFSGWNTSADGTGTNYDPSISYTVTGDITFYAKWNVATYVISFNINGTSYSNTSDGVKGAVPSNKTVSPGNSIILTGGNNLRYVNFPGYSNNYTYSAYAFSGWNTAANGSGTNYNVGSSYTPTGNIAAITLYARWISDIHAPFYIEDFEWDDGASQGSNAINVVNGGSPSPQTNKWTVGTATKYAGAKSAYISSNNGTSNIYNTTASSKSHIYLHPLFPSSSTPYTLSFYWKAQGDAVDCLEVYKIEGQMEQAINPDTTGGQTCPGTKIGTYNLGGTDTWNLATITIPAITNPDVRMYIVFSWINDSSGGAAPPAAIDNITIYK